MNDTERLIRRGNEFHLGYEPSSFVWQWLLEAVLHLLRLANRRSPEKPEGMKWPTRDSIFIRRDGLRYRLVDGRLEVSVRLASGRGYGPWVSSNWTSDDVLECADFIRGDA